MVSVTATAKDLRQANDNARLQRQLGEVRNHYSLKAQNLKIAEALDIVGLKITHALQDENIKRRKIGEIKPHAGGTTATGYQPFQIGSCPVQNRHEIITNRFNSGLRQMTKTDFVVFQMGTPLSLLLLDIFRHRQAFNHVPLQAR